jgi:hypothetical protein
MKSQLLIRNICLFKAKIFKKNANSRECLRNLIKYSDEAQVKCPHNQEYICNRHIQDREIRALLSESELEKYLLKSLQISEATMQNTVHCKTPDCIGFCVSEDNLNFFDCKFLLKLFFKCLAKYDSIAFNVLSKVQLVKR